MINNLQYVSISRVDDDNSNAHDHDAALDEENPTLIPALADTITTEATSLEIDVRTRSIFIPWCAVLYIILILSIANTTSILMTSYFERGGLIPFVGIAVRIPVQNGDKRQGSGQQKYKHSKCISLNSSKIGNGSCDVDLNNAECNYDGGDCARFNSLFPNCISRHPDRLFNHWCDLELNNEQCGYDNGACKEFNEKYKGKCVVDYPSLLGNGVCDESGDYNTKECGWDGGDCTDHHL